MSFRADQRPTFGYFCSLFLNPRRNSQWWNPLVVNTLHLLLHNLAKWLLAMVIVNPKSMWAYAFPLGATPAALTSLDYVSAALMMLATVLQNGSELQVRQTLPLSNQRCCGAL